MSELAVKSTAQTDLLHEEAEKREEEVVRSTNQAGTITVVVYRHLCKGCEICAQVCPKGVLKMILTPDRWEGSTVEIVDIESCNACMLCEYQCPDFSIEVYSVKKEAKAKEKMESA